MEAHAQGKTTQSRKSAPSVPESSPAREEDNPVELYFTCPVTGKGYLAEDWRILGELKMRENPEGGKVLVGMVEVECPWCRRAHAYPTEELVCPLSQAETMST